MRFAQILNNVVHWIFEADEKPDLPPDPEGNQIIIIDITNNSEVQESWGYSPDTGEFIKPIIPEPVEPQPIPQPVTNEEVAQAVMYLIAIEDVKEARSQPQNASVFDMEAESPRYEFWRFAYYNRQTNVFTLDSRLVPGGVLTQEERDQIVSEGQRPA